MVIISLFTKGIPLEDLMFIDNPEIKLRNKESCIMPFRYLADTTGNAKIPPGMLEHLKMVNDEPLV
jgi:ribosome biogenesis SPOUT family RNA methylase Rps3